MARPQQLFSQFDDLFFTRGDDDDAREDELVDFDDVTIEMEKNSEIQVLPVEEDPVPVEEDPVQVEEQRLSQRLSQLSATSKRPTEEPEPTVVAKKKMKTDDEMPSYLSAKKRWFDQELGPLLQNTTSSMTIDDLRQIAWIIHHLAFTRQWITVWQTYLLSGTGQLHKQPPGKDNPAVWPVDVKTTMIKQRVTTARKEAEIDDAACLNYAQTYLRRLQIEVDRLQAQLSEQKRTWLAFTREMEMAIEKFVRLQYMIQVELKLQSKVIIVECEYNDRLIELDYRRLKPNQEQLKTFDLLSRAKREREGTKYNVELLKQRVFHQQLPPLFDTVQAPTDALITALGGPSDYSTYHLRTHCDRIIQQAKSQLMNVYVGAAELRAHHSEHQFGREMYKMQQIRIDPFAIERLSDSMLEVLQRRFKHIEERIRRLYQLKTDFFEEAPAVTSKYL
jgi:hypothetical protein